MIDLPLALVSRLQTLPATAGLYPNNLACSEVADGAIGGALFADEFEINALPLAAATTELVAGKLEVAEFANDIEATLPKCSAVFLLSDERRQENWKHMLDITV